MAYLEGIGVEKNCELALGWFNKSADLGERRAMYNLGDLYAKGICVPQNKIQAEQWYKKSTGELVKK
jgi:TPR repeat protein